MVIATIFLGLFGLLALWTLISPESVYWALTAWQYKDPDANEPSDAAYTMSRVGALVTLVVLIVFGVQASGWQAEAQTSEDCKTFLLPALRDVVRSKPVAPSALEDFARTHGLTMTTSTFRVATYPTQRRSVSASPRSAGPSPSGTGTSTKKPSVTATPTSTPTPTRPTAARPTTSVGSTTISTYNFQRNRTTVLSWTDSSSAWGPNPSCKV